ncbi:MAG: T9SS type A sorting domain-containing protein [Candidatus Delongbacteria bacterium]|nr:T9SS type A sorting domain-containing protein [Candidatus Delongbacteria bacterium]
MKKLMFLLFAFTIFYLQARTAYENQKTWDNDFSSDITKTIIPQPQNRVHRAGLLWLNTTNMGYLGNPDTYDDPCTGQVAESGEMPGGSGMDFIFVSGLMFGGYNDSEVVNVNGTDATVFEGPYVTTAYEGWSGNPMPKEMWPVMFDADESGSILGRMNETSNVEGKLNCLFEEVYNPSATAEEQFSTMFTDKFVLRTPYTGMDEYDNREHIPLGIEVKQKTYSWSYEFAQKFIIVDYTIYNRHPGGKDIFDFFMGLYMDCDIGPIGGDITYNHADDLGGFIQKWDGYIDPASGEQKTMDLNLAWAADNDGRSYTGTNFYSATGEPGAGSVLDGATGVVAVKVLRNPSPNMRYAYNMYIASSNDEAQDWSPHWKTGLHSDWNYDLTPEQLGYDDYNQDGLTNGGGQPLAGGRVEGRPAGDKGKYMVMSNDEFDYNQYDIISVDNGTYSDPEYMIGSPYAQAEKWQEWLDPTEPLPSPADVHDGGLDDRNDIANGADTKAILSFGPLGTQRQVNIAVDTDDNGVMDDFINNKSVWEFAYGDSIKLTLAFIAGENFHTSLQQDPTYSDPAARFPVDGLDPSLFDKGWYDVLNNVIWCERMYDIPMFDTPVEKYGEKKGDGWYGEDIGVDGIFAGTGITECWWTDPASGYAGPDEGESNFELDNFTSPITDIYGHNATGEDNLLPFGREIGDFDFGHTNDYGCMVLYDNFIDPYPGIAPGQLVRYGFDNGRLDPGDGVPDFTGPPPPPSPKIEVRFEENDVIVEWNSVEFYTMEDETEAYSGPELFIDPFTREKDFESYTVKISPNSNANNFIDLLTVDNINYAYQNVADLGDYLDKPIHPDSIAAHPENYPALITESGKIWELVPFGDNKDIVANHSVNDIFEYTVTPAVVTINEGTPAEETVNYHQYGLRLFNKYLENASYISVVSTDFGDPRAGIPANTSSIYTNMKKIGGVEDEETVIPGVTKLYQNYPNPFNPDTKINFILGKAGNVKLNIYNVSGQLIEKLIDEDLDSGYHSKIFKADKLNSGIYYYTLQADNKKITKKMVLVK